MSPDDPRHGTRRGYYAHRKAGQDACDTCRRAAAAAQARYEMLRSRGVASRLPPHGVQRRIRALSAIGYTWERIDQELGEISRQSEKWATGPMRYVFPSTYAKVAEVYERLSMTLPPDRTPGEKRAASRSRNRARQRGWAPPLAWDDIDDPNETPRGLRDNGLGDVDPIVVDRIIGGEYRLRANAAERAEVARRWAAGGLSLRTLAAHTGWRVDRYYRRGDVA